MAPILAVVAATDRLRNRVAEFVEVYRQYKASASGLVSEVLHCCIDVVSIDSRLHDVPIGHGPEDFVLHLDCRLQKSGSNPVVHFIVPRPIRQVVVLGEALGVSVGTTTVGRDKTGGT